MGLWKRSSLRTSPWWTWSFKGFRWTYESPGESKAGVWQGEGEGQVQQTCQFCGPSNNDGSYWTVGDALEAEGQTRQGERVVGRPLADHPGGGIYDLVGNGIHAGQSRAKLSQLRPVTKREELQSTLEGTAIYRTPVTTDTLMRAFQGRYYLDVSGDVPSEQQLQQDLSPAVVQLPPNLDSLDLTPGRCMKRMARRPWWGFTACQDWHSFHRQRWRIVQFPLSSLLARGLRSDDLYMADLRQGSRTTSRFNETFKTVGLVRRSLRWRWALDLWKCVEALQRRVRSDLLTRNLKSYVKSWTMRRLMATKLNKMDFNLDFLKILNELYQPMMVMHFQMEKKKQRLELNFLEKRYRHPTSMKPCFDMEAMLLMDFQYNYVAVQEAINAHYQGAIYLVDMLEFMKALKGNSSTTTMKGANWSLRRERARCRAGDLRPLRNYFLMETFNDCWLVVDFLYTGETFMAAEVDISPGGLRLAVEE